jgi:uncharacterized OsmC-like protein
LAVKYVKRKVENSMANIKFSVDAKSESSTKTVVETRGFKIIIDEPENLGGTNDGANPVEYVLAALAGCLNVVGHLVAKEMGINISGIEMHLEGELNPARFAGKSMEDRAGYKKVTVAMKPKSDADPELLKKWLQVVESRCPVSDNIANQTPVEIVLA